MHLLSFPYFYLELNSSVEAKQLDCRFAPTSLKTDVEVVKKEGTHKYKYYPCVYKYKVYAIYYVNIYVFTRNLSSCHYKSDIKILQAYDALCLNIMRKFFRREIKVLNDFGHLGAFERFRGLVLRGSTFFMLVNAYRKMLQFEIESLQCKGKTIPFCILDSRV